MMPTTGAILLAGGRASRLGGLDKPLFEVQGRPLLQRAVDAAAGCDPVVIVGPRRPGIDGAPRIRSLVWLREDPPFSGPAAAIVAALDHLSEPDDGAHGPASPSWLFVLAADLVDPVAAVTRLHAARATSSDGDARGGFCLSDGDARPQWLTGLYPVDELRAAARALPGRGVNAPARALLAPLGAVVLAAPTDATIDIDTWDDVAPVRAAAPAPPVRTLTSPPSHLALPEGDLMSDRTLPPEALDAWAAALRERFGLAEDDLPISLILDLARDVANGVARPAAPFSAFVAGLVAGRAGGTPDDVRTAVAAVVDLATAWDGAPGGTH